MNITKSSANLLTLTRLAVSPVAFLLILDYRDELGASWSLFILAVLVAASDLFDGRIARHYEATSGWGAFFDPLADKVIVLGCALSFASVGRYWWLPAILLCVREVPIGAFRFYHMAKGFSVHASLLAKWKTTIQGTTLAAAACPPLNTYEYLHVVLIWISVGVTFYTGIEYLKGARSIKGEPNKDMPT